MTVWKHGRATVRSPGKYGENDYRAEVTGRCPIALTLGEYALLLGGKLLAEDRFDKPWQQGRFLYLAHLRNVALAESMDDVRDVAERAQAEVDERTGGAAGFVRCYQGGMNDCVSLCRDCWSAGYRLSDDVVRQNLAWWGLAGDRVEEFVAKVQRR